MKVAVTYENGEVFQHFGRTPQFKVYEIENGEILSEQVMRMMLSKLTLQDHSRRSARQPVITMSTKVMRRITAAMADVINDSGRKI